jgi:hypothetical protein
MLASRSQAQQRYLSGQSGTLTRKRSLVQIQYGPRVVFAGQRLATDLSSVPAS